MSREAFKKVTDLGTATVGGQQLAPLLGAAWTSARHRRAPGPAGAGRDPQDATYDVWLDSQGRMARFEMLVKSVHADDGDLLRLRRRAAHVVAPPASAMPRCRGISTAS